MMPRRLKVLPKPSRKQIFGHAGKLLECYPWRLHWDPFSKEVCFHWFRPVVLWHPGGKRHGCHFIVINGSAQWFSGARCSRSSLSPNVFTEAFSLFNGSTDHCVYFYIIVYALVDRCASTRIHFYTGSYATVQ